mmetsp:Transcript_115763/g.248755  ORF Transcript_115763/g.248755 Transcript_115763/m.248755 type:complete len:232 (+) Transcript_115763:331-1026(+)
MTSPYLDFTKMTQAEFVASMTEQAKRLVGDNGQLLEQITSKEQEVRELLEEHAAKQEEWFDLQRQLALHKDKAEELANELREIREERQRDEGRMRDRSFALVERLMSLNTDNERLHEQRWHQVEQVAAQKEQLEEGAREIARLQERKLVLEGASGSQEPNEVESLAVENLEGLFSRAHSPFSRITSSASEFEHAPPVLPILPTAPTTPASQASRRPARRDESVRVHFGGPS